MIFGNKAEFAIEAYLDNDYEMPNSIFGRVSCWIGNKPLGDIEEPACVLGVTTHSFIKVLKSIPEQKMEIFESLTDEEVFNYIDPRLYGHDEGDLKDIIEIAKDLWPYDFLTNGGESFDNYKSYIIKERSEFRILFYDYSKETLYSGRVSESCFYEAVSDFITWHDKELKANQALLLDKQEQS